MSNHAVKSHLTFAELQQALREASDCALLVEPRILRRVIKQDRRLAGLGWNVPHRKTYTIQRDRLLVIAERSELELAPGDDLPKKLILIAKPSDDEALDLVPADEVLYSQWRLLFHATVHLEVDQRLAEGSLGDREIWNRVRQIGLTEFEEIRAVLQRDELLLPPADDAETYAEFLAVYLELRYFAPDDLPSYFPAIRDWGLIDRLVSEEIHHERLHRESRLPGAPERLNRKDQDESLANAATLAPSSSADPLQPSPPKYWRFQARAERASGVGNGVKAAILRMKASQLALPDRAAEAKQSARAELQRLVARLQPVFQLTDDERRHWSDAIQPLLEPAIRGLWNNEQRLLYDLQKVCVEHERGVYSVDLIGYCTSLFKQPLRRPLPLLREVLITKHLRTAARRLATARMSDAARQRLKGLLEAAVDRVEERSRDKIRPLIATVLDDVGLVPKNVPERVARRKLVEELLDLVVEHGFFSMGNLRDALSRNSLKLSDVSGIMEVLRGDCLLRADKQLATKLDGVYRRGAIYLRMPQRMSSLAFGTNYGRWFTKYLALPYGGAYLALEGLRHLVGPLLARGKATAAPTPNAPEKASHVAAKGAADAAHNATSKAVNAVSSSPAPSEASATETAVSKLVDAASSSDAPDVTNPSEVIESVVEATQDAASRATHEGDMTFFASLFVLGTLIFFLIHRPNFRAWCGRCIVTMWQLSRRALYDIPSKLLHSSLVQKILRSQTYSAIRSYALRPATFTALASLPSWLAGITWSSDFTLHVFMGLALFLNSPIGRYADERVTDLLVRFWHELRVRVFAAAFHLVMDLFHRFMETFERVLYIVDEWLRFRSGDSRLSLMVKALLGVGWVVVTYFIRIYVTLLVEPQINPIKHFPVVTVSHKIMLPYSIILTQIIAAPMQPFLGSVLSNTFAGATVFLMPGLFGFLVWELKENWRLYEANRAKNLQPARIGHHGETMLSLLRPGFHSGTLPKLFARLRRALRRSQRSGDWRAVNQWHAELHHVEVAVRRFMQRELGVLLEEAGVFPRGSLMVGHIHLATNRVEIELICRISEETRGRICFDDHAGWLVASQHPVNWTNRWLDAEQAAFYAARCGLYKRAGIELDREQLVATLPESVGWYEIETDGLSIYRDLDPESRTLLPWKSKSTSDAAIDGDGGIQLLAQRATREETSTPVIFGRSPITWERWVAIWEPTPNPALKEPALGTSEQA